MTGTLFRGAGFLPATANPETRTVRATISTGAAVPRRDVRGPYLETLALDGVDVADIIGKPVLDAHRQGSVGDVIGVVQDAGRDTTGLWADIRFSERADAVWKDVVAGILRGVSIGYRVEAWDEGKDANGARQRIARRWAIQEVSFVPVPADPGATVRGKETDMSEANPAPELTRAETNTQIRALARTTGLDRDWADGQIDAGASIENARAAAIEALETRTMSREAMSPAVARVTNDNEAPEAVRGAMAGAIAARWTRTAPEGRAREFMNHTVIDMVADLMGRRGERVDARNRTAVADLLFSRGAAHSTSDFPFLLQDAANKMMLPGYQAAAPTYRQVAGVRTFADFKPHKFLRIGDFPALEEISESGELRYGTISENRETVTAKELGSGFILNRRVLVNDDLRQFAEFSTMAGVRAAADENRLFFAMLAQGSGAGPALADGKAVFHADHGNKAATGAALSVTTYGLAVAALRKQAGIDGVPLNIAPAVLLVGPDTELAARQLLTAVTPSKASDVNPWSGNAVLAVDANITGNAWYVFADPALYPVFVAGYLAGQEGPQIRSEIDFDSRALKVALNLDFGYGAVESRGGFFNPGA